MREYALVSTIILLVKTILIMRTICVCDTSSQKYGLPSFCITDLVV